MLLLLIYHLSFIICMFSLSLSNTKLINGICKVSLSRVAVLKKWCGSLNKTYCWCQQIIHFCIVDQLVLARSSNKHYTTWYCNTLQGIMGCIGWPCIFACIVIVSLFRMFACNQGMSFWTTLCQVESSQTYHWSLGSVSQYRTTI